MRILALVRRLDPLDVPEGETGSIHVYALTNADSETLAGTLNSLVTGQGTQRAAAGAGRPGAPGAPAAAPGVAPAPGQVIQTQAFEGTIKIAHDKPTNSLVIISSAKDYLALREVIRKLDLPRRQVFVEATILEISLDRTRKIGFAYHAGQTFDLKNPDDSIYFGGVEASQLSSLSTSPATLNGLIGGVIGPQIPGLSIPSIGVLFQLVQNTDDVNVLSSPNILTTDNEPAEISVGENIPYLSTTLGGAASSALAAAGTAANGATATANPLLGLGLGGLAQSIQRQDLALDLKITPHVNDSDFVRLEIEQDIKDIISENFGGNGPVWSNRKVKTMIVVKDQQPVVIGGLMSEKLTLTESKVPLLGDIPLIGYLFKYQSRERQKTNLLIFLTPYIIKDQSDIQRIFEQKVREKREFIEAYTAFDGKEWEPNLDYRRKRGLLAEINKAVQQADDDEKMLRDIEKQKVRKRAEEGPVELPPDLQRNNNNVQEQPQPEPPPVPEPLPPGYQEQ
jgi:general secretion pathway protein D